MIEPRADVPSISALSPTFAALGSSSLRLTVNGARFTHASVVRWNGADRTTTYIGATQLQADIPASDLTTAGTRQVTVFTPGNNGGASNPATFTVGNPAPTVAALGPGTALLGGEPFTLVVTGSNFVPGATAQWGDRPLQTTVQSSSRLSASIPAAFLSVEGTAQITVVNPAPLGGRSGAIGLPVAHLAPVITSLSPATQTIAPFSGFTFRVNGQNFLRSVTQVAWVASYLTYVRTTWVSPTQLDVAIGAEDADSAGTYKVGVLTTAYGSTKTSAVSSFELTNFAPVIQSGPSLVERGSIAPLEFTGMFARGVTTAIVKGRVAGRSSDWGKLTVSLAPADTASTGRLRLEVTTPPPGGGTVSRDLSVVNPKPHILLLSPATVARNAPAFTLTVSGERFVSGAVVRWNGSDRPTTFVTASRLLASIPSSDITVGGTATITVVNPAPAIAPSDPKELGIMETMIKVPD